jgi:large subunit ribosomal protein L29
VLAVVDDDKPDPTMKASEAHKMTGDELKVETKRLRDRLYELRSQSVTEKLENPKQLGQIRRDVARLMTEQRKRQLAAAQETA